MQLCVLGKDSNKENIPIDRDQRSWVFRNDPKILCHREKTNKYFKKRKTLEIPSEDTRFIWQMLSTI